MQELKDLKHKLCKELKEYSNKPMSMGDLDTVDKLTHAIKNLDKVIESAEREQNQEYSNRYSNNGAYGNGGLFGYTGGSYVGDGTSNVNRDSMGRYSRENEPMMQELKRMMNSTSDGRIRNEMQSFIDRIGRM